ncbi:hypothetical protein [Frankia sp. AiPa1]|uniref:hypothetical protein n=1 Tax=Frankia sp. AiPa1 TaxID=573492 RepID=UPI0035A83537
MLQRPSEDVDLFADWDRRADFPAAVDAVIAAYRADGLEVETELRTELITRLHVADPGQPDVVHRVELVANWRIQRVSDAEAGTRAICVPGRRVRVRWVSIRRRSVRARPGRRWPG